MFVCIVIIVSICFVNFEMIILVCEFDIIVFKFICYFCYLFDGEVGLLIGK